MNLRERHRDVAAYALGVLDPADAFRFEEHLSECVLCAVRLTDFTPVVSALSDLAGPGRPETPPAPRLLDRMLHEVGAFHRRSSRRRLRLVAAAAALIVALPALVVGLSRDAGAGPVERIAATDSASGVYGAVDLRASDWGTAVALRVARLRGPRTCELVAIGKDGEEHTVTSWSVPSGGYGIPGSPGNEKPLDIEVGTAMQDREIDRFEVRTVNGDRLVSLKR
ncbi:anti-sigma factor family protein [Streptomyces sp. NPDC054841]